MLEFVELKQKYDAIVKAIGKGQEPMDELISVRNFLNEVSANDGTILRGASSEGAAPDVE